MSIKDLTSKKLDNNLLKLADIIIEILEGKLEHKQNRYFCGTACCVAGWYVAKDSSVIQPEKAEERENYHDNPFAYFDEGSLNSFPWNLPPDYVKEQCGLTEMDCEDLFCFDLSINKIAFNMFHILKKRNLCNPELNKKLLFDINSN